MGRCGGARLSVEPYLERSEASLRASFRGSVIPRNARRARASFVGKQGSTEFRPTNLLHLSVNSVNVVNSVDFSGSLGRKAKEPDGEENPSGPLLFNPRLLLTVVVFTPCEACAALLR